MFDPAFFDASFFQTGQQQEPEVQLERPAAPNRLLIHVNGQPIGYSRRSRRRRR
jgi:hypothetical protein